MGLPRLLMVKNLPTNAGNMGWISGSGRFPWRRKWQPTPVFLPGESHGEEPGGLQSRGSQSVRHDIETKQPQLLPHKYVQAQISFHEENYKFLKRWDYQTT